jgi:hypothetical protein
LSLSCSCDYDGGDNWKYTPPKDYSTLATKRARRCCSCKEKISVGDMCGVFHRSRPPMGDIEERIYDGNDVDMSTWYMCEECTDQYFNLTALDFCIMLGGDDGNMKLLLKDYQQMKNGEVENE